MPTKRSIRLRVVVTLTVLVVCLAALAGWAARQYSELVEAQTRSNHNYLVIDALRNVELGINSDRGLFYCAASGDRVFMRSPMRGEDFEISRRKLLLLTRGNPAQQQRVARLDALWIRWQTEFIVPLAALCDRPPDAPRPSRAEMARLAEAGNASRNEMRAALTGIEGAEQHLLDTWQKQLVDAQSRTVSTLVAAGLVALALSIGSALWLIGAASAQDRLNRELEGEVSERRVAERRLADSESRVRAVLDHVPDAIVTVDGRGRIQSFNPAAEAMFGYQAVDIVGQDVAVLIPGSPLGLQEITPDAVLGVRREASARHADGQRFPIDVAFSAIAVDGEHRFTGIIRDISDAKRQEEEIKRFKAVLDNARDMIFMFDPVTLALVYVNQGLVAALGIARGTLLAMRACDLTPAMPAPVFREQIAALRADQKSGLAYEASYRRADGSDLPAEVFLQLVRDTGGVGLFVAIARDLTERRRVELMKSEFVSVVSHELRSPLTSIRGALGLLAGAAAGEMPDKMRRMVEIANQNSERLVRLINDILDIEKIESSKADFAMRPVDLAAIVDDAVEALHAYADQYGVRYVVSHEPALASVDDAERTVLAVNGDADRLTQVLTNLLSNAAKFAPRGSDVRVSVARRRGGVRVAVSDCGPGIPEAFRARVFEKFSQADASDARKKGGTGLGLSICKAIIERHEGVIGFDTREAGANKDSGTTFWFQLPGLPSTSVQTTSIRVEHV